MSLLLAALLGCPFCEAPTLTLSEQLDASDVVVLAEWVDAERGTLGRTAADPDESGTPASTTYRVVKAVKGPYEDGRVLRLAGYQPGEKEETYLLTGSGSDVLQWDLPTEISRGGFDYLSNSPDPGQPTAERLKYFVKYLEHPDELVSNDAYGEFANAPYEEIEKVRGVLPREKLHGWIADPEVNPARLGLYGLLLGLSGGPEDAELMRERILDPDADFRIGIDGVMSGYLLLTGEQGLDLIQKTKLEDAPLTDADGKPVTDENGDARPVPFSETYAAMQAVRFMWTYGAGAIDKERLRAAMRTLLGRPELADIVIADLSRWQDWSVMERLATLYEDEDFAVPAIKRSIVKYLITASRDVPADGPKPAHAVRAEELLAEITERDPKTVRDAKRFMFLDSSYFPLRDPANAKRNGLNWVTSRRGC